MAEDTTPKQLPTLPLPPIGGDRASWIRWGIQIALLLAALYFTAEANQKVEKVEEVQVQMQMKLDAK